MAEPASTAAPEAGGKKSRGKILILAAVVALALGVGGGAAFAFFGTGSARAERPAEPKPIQYYEIKNSFTSNLRESDRLIQVKIAVSTTGGEEVLAALERHQPAIVAEVLSSLSSATEEQAESREGRERLGAQFRKDINGVLRRNGVHGEINHVYLTGLVLQ